MNVKKTMLSTFLDMLKEVWLKSSVSNRFLIFAFIANIPSPLIFFPYVTQAFTMISLGIYLYNFPKVGTSQSKSNTILGIPVIQFALVVITILLQLFWVPFVTQLLSIALIVSILLLSRKFQ